MSDSEDADLQSEERERERRKSGVVFDSSNENESAAENVTISQQSDSTMNGPSSNSTADSDLDQVPGDELKVLCERLKLSEMVINTALSLWKVFMRSKIDELVNDAVGSFVCSLYIAVIDNSQSLDSSLTPCSQDGPCITVSDLLRTANYSIISFCKLFQILKSNVQLSDKVSQHLHGVVKKYLLTVPLFQKFEQIFNDIFQKSDNCAPVNCYLSEHDQKEYSERKEFAWTLFVYVKSQIADSSGLVFNFHLLLCCLNYVLRMTPRFQLKPPFDNLRVTDGDVETDVKMLYKLSQLYHGQFEEVQRIQAVCFYLIIEKLPQCSGSIDCEAMKKMYEEQYLALGDINEMEFLDYEPYLELTDKEPNNNRNQLTVQSTHNSTHHEDVTTMQVTLTPVRAALTSVGHLQSLLTNISEHGSENLQKYFQQCATNPQPYISKVLDEMKSVFINSYKMTMGKKPGSVAELRFNMAVKLYYRVLEFLLKQEENRLSERHFSDLLHNKVSHKCLLACAVEVVMAAYSRNTLKITTPQSPGVFDDASGSTVFPWILKVFDLNGFDFFIVLENFICAESHLTEEIIRHLHAVEQHLLECTAWKMDSPLFEALASCEITCDHSNTSNLQNMECSESSTQHVVVQGPKSGTVNSPRLQRSHGLNRFLNKVCKLAYQRLQLLCNKLKISKDIQLKIWTCVEYCIVKQPNLLVDRHLDHIIMCSIYAVCLVTEQELKFRAIVAVYKEMPHASQQTYKRVLISGKEYDSIIGFYNNVFTQTLKNYLLKFAKNKTSNTMSPGTKNLGSSLPDSPLYPLPGCKNFYVSPLKGSSFRSPTVDQMTPRTRQLINLGDGFGSEEKFKEINNWMKTTGSHLRAVTGAAAKSSKRLSFDQMDEPQMSEEPMMLVKRRRTNMSKMPTSSNCNDTVTKSDKEKES